MCSLVRTLLTEPQGRSCMRVVCNDAYNRYTFPLCLHRRADAIVGTTTATRRTQPTVGACALRRRSWPTTARCDNLTRWNFGSRRPMVLFFVLPSDDWSFRWHRVANTGLSMLSILRCESLSECFITYFFHSFLSDLKKTDPARFYLIFSSKSPFSNSTFSI